MRAALNLRGVLATGMHFNSAQSHRLSRLLASDYNTTALIARVVQSLQNEARGIQAEITLWRSDILEYLDDGDIDLIVSPKRFLSPDHPRELVFEERHAVVGCARNRFLQQPLSEADYFGRWHVVVRVSGGGTFADNFLGGQGTGRQIKVICAVFAQGLWMLAGTTRLALMHARRARVFALQSPLAMQQAPIQLPMTRGMMQNHSARAADRGLASVRGKPRAAIMDIR